MALSPCHFNHRPMHAAVSTRPPDSIRVYTKPILSVYDSLVMGPLAKLIWGCPADNFVAHYRKHITSNHADIGVGTGYCIDQCEFDTANPRIALIDLQPNCLEHTAKRLARYEPQTYLFDALQPMRVPGRRFDSIGLGGLLHCLPGGIGNKGRVFDALKPLAAPGAKVFGYSMTAASAPPRFTSQVATYLLNRLRLIDNVSDHIDELSVELRHRFVDCQVEQIGQLAFFSAVVPRGDM